MSNRTYTKVQAARLPAPGVNRWAVMVLMVVLAVALSAGARAEVHESQHHNFQVVTVAEGLQHPWGMTWLPNGDMLVTERPGRLRLIQDGELVEEPISGVPTVRVGGQGGLLDIALHPDFDNNRYVYLSFAKPNADDSEGTTAVVRGRLEGHALVDVEEIFEADAWHTGRGHHGSRLAFDHDGYLFITLGDRQIPPVGDVETHPAQDLRNHIGGIFRLHDDGRVPSDNPFVGHDYAKPEFWSYGHRSVQGLAVHPETGALWSNEHGPQGGDELNLIKPGKNYGWPVVGHGVHYRTGATIHIDRQRDDMEPPIHYWTPSIATSGLMIYDGDQFPEWQGHIFNGGMAGQHQMLSRVEVNEDNFVVYEEQLLRGEMRIRDVRQGPDGYIYLAVDDRGGALTPIVRLEPAD
jgi:glucose/arabinose dehydrogenase